LVSRETLAQYAANSAEQEKPGSKGAGFDLERYLTKHGFEVIQRKPWQSNPGGVIYELARCPFNADHSDGSAAFTLVKGVPGFTCQHSGCQGKAIKDVFAEFPADSAIHPEVEESPKQAQILCELAAAVQLFHTADGEAYAHLPVENHWQTWALRRKGFRRWLVREFYKTYKKPPSAQALQDAIGLLEAKAQFESPEVPVYVRIAENAGNIYVDLCNERWEAVEITAHGWGVVSDPPIRFRRAKGMQALPCPVRGGSLRLLRDLINIGNDANWVLCQAWLVAAWRPRGPYPILNVHGEQGSAKSTTVKLLRRVIDPSAALVRTPPRDERDLVIAASNSWLLAYDNVSGIQPWLSDALCRVATGGGFSTRELFTESDELFFEGARPISLNGIDYLAERADLADRAVILNLPRIDEASRREEADLYAEFESKLPQILGSLCDAVSKALARFPQVKLARKPRMADFAVWAVAAAPALGFSEEAFLDAYCGNRADAVSDTLEGDPVAAAILSLMEERAEKDGGNVWEGSCKALLTLLESLVDDGVKRSPDWPKTPRSLSGRLRRLVTFLREVGMHVGFPPKGTKGKRSVTITRICPHSTATTATTASTTPADTNDAPDQSVAAEGRGGGHVSEMAVQSSPSGEPPPESPFSNPFKRREKRPEVAEVAKVAVVCPMNLPGGASGAAADPVGVCSKCGPAHWQRLGGVLICPKCGQPASSDEPGSLHERIERFEL
jgi:hypothetical protein